MPRSHYYLSVDVEADGPIPGAYSMISFGAVAFLADGTVLGEFEDNLSPLPDAEVNPDTMTWWAKHPEAWAYCIKDPHPAVDAMRAFDTFLRRIPGTPTLVVYPTYDFMFVYWYYVRFVGFPAPFSFAALDLKTLAAEKLNKQFRSVGKRGMPREWRDAVTVPHDHTPLNDAKGQMQLALAMGLPG